MKAPDPPIADSTIALLQRRASQAQHDLILLTYHLIQGMQISKVQAHSGAHQSPKLHCSCCSSASMSCPWCARLLTTEQLSLQGGSLSITTSLTILSWDANPLCLMHSEWCICYVHSPCTHHDLLSSKSWWFSHWIGYDLERSKKNDCSFSPEQ